MKTILQKSITFGGKPSDLDIVLFTKHLATMVKAGISVGEALETLSSYTKSHAFSKVLKQVLKSVQNGQSLSSSLAKYPRVFSSFYVSLIEVSEESGSLDENLEFIAKQLAKNHALRKKIQSASLYPSLVFFASMIMGGFIAFFILPQLVDFFTVLNIELPITTKILLFFAYAFRDYGIAIVAAFLALFTGFHFLIKTTFFKPIWDTFLLRVPLFGPFIRASQIAQFTRNLGVLVKSGVPIATAVSITADTLSNYQFKHICKAIYTTVEKGSTIASQLEKENQIYYPPIVSKMIRVGEKTGNLDDSLLYLADFYEDEIETMSKNLTTLLEPLLLLVIGLLVGFVALAIISPIYELSGSIRS